MRHAASYATLMRPLNCNLPQWPYNFLEALPTQNAFIYNFTHIFIPIEKQK